MFPGGRLSCQDVLRRLDDYLDRALTDAALRRVEAHLSDCVACAATVRFESTLIEGIRSRLRRIAVPPGLREAIHTRLTTETPNSDGRTYLPPGGP